MLDCFKNMLDKKELDIKKHELVIFVENGFAPCVRDDKDYCMIGYYFKKRNKNMFKNLLSNKSYNADYPTCGGFWININGRSFTSMHSGLHECGDISYYIAQNTLSEIPVLSTLYLAEKDEDRNLCINEGCSSIYNFYKKDDGENVSLEEIANIANEINNQVHERVLKINKQYNSEQFQEASEREL